MTFLHKGILAKISFERIILIIEYLIFSIANNFLFIVGFIFIFFSLFNKKLKKIKLSLHNIIFKFFSRNYIDD